jgi:hypothetical protein
MQKDLGIVVTGRFVEQHGSKALYETEGQKGSTGAGVPSRGGSPSVRECLSAGCKFARQCEYEGITSRGFRIT